MPTIPGSFWRDANWVPIADDGVTSSKAITLSGNNTTVATPLFRVTGNVEVRALYGVVTTTLGSNQTAAHWRTNDQTATLPISASAGTTVSSLGVGSLLVRKSLVSVALTADNSTAAKVIDPVAATAPGVFMPFQVVQKVGGVNTDIEYVYTTTNTPTTGAITFYIRWVPLTEDSNLVVL